MDYDIIIIGGGPAGLTAGIYNARAGLKTLVLESYTVSPQAILTDAIENYPGFPDGIGGFELVEKFKKQAEKFGAKILSEDVKKIEECKIEKAVGFKIEAGKNIFTSLALVIAAGARPKKIGIPGEDKLQGKGVSYCATCDGPLYKDKEVIVLGGGDSAVEEALFLTRFVRKVTLIHRRDRLRAAKVLQERAFANKKIEFIWESAVVEIIGEDKVKAVKVKNIKTQKESEISCNGVFVFVGYTPNTDFLKGFLKLDEAGYIVADSNMNTSRKGVFACGDCRQKVFRQVVTAAGDGSLAAFSAQQYVEELRGIAYK